MIPANATQLPLPLIGRRRVLVPVEVAQALLDLTSREVAGLVESGKIGPAFNIGQHLDGRRALRIFRDSLLAFKAAKAANGSLEKKPTVGLLPKAGCKADDAPGNIGLECALAVIIPNRPTIPASELARRLACSQLHISALVKSGELQVSSPGNRINRTASLSTASAVQFLSRRKV